MVLKDIIFIGSTHGFADDFLKQNEVISSVFPEYILCEDLEDFILDSDKKLSDFLVNKTMSDMTSFDEVKNLVELCLSKGIKLIGFDFKNFGLSSSLQEKIKLGIALSQDEESELNDVLEKREKHHLKMILDYLAKTDKPFVVILGSWHLREGSLLRNSLSYYKIIALCDQNGDLVFGPQENTELIYREWVFNAKKD